MTEGTELFQAAVAMHEMFQTFLQAGFTEQQALYLVAQGLREGVIQGNTDE